MDLWEMYTDFCEVYGSNSSWKYKYDLCFKIYAAMREAGMPTLDYYDPDSTYEDDTRALYMAVVDWYNNAGQLHRISVKYK